MVGYNDFAAIDLLMMPDAPDFEAAAAHVLRECGGSVWGSRSADVVVLVAALRQQWEAGRRSAGRGDPGKIVDVSVDARRRSWETEG